MLILLKAAFAAGLVFSLLQPSAADARCATKYPSDGRVEWKCVTIGRGESLESLFPDEWQDVARFNRMDRRHAYPGASIKVPADLTSIKDFTPIPAYYPPADIYNKFVLVDLSEQFLGAYEKGRLVFSAPIASGGKDNPTPAGTFLLTTFSKNHRSSKYYIEKTSTLYPMNYALRFFVSREGISYWLHGRDMPGNPASHGCIGLYDEEMQKKHYGYPENPVLNDAKKLYEWATKGQADPTGPFDMRQPIRIEITGKEP